MERKRITHVAIRVDGEVFSLPEPNRHHDVIALIIRTTDHVTVEAYDDDQGFLDEDGRYLTRKQALVNALMHDQVKDPDNIRADMLFSEDLW